MDPEDAAVIPDNRLSSIPVPSEFLPPDDQGGNALIDYEMGGVALNDPSQGLLVKQWSCYIGENGMDVFLQAGSETPILVFSTGGIDSLSFTFDQNMRPAICYTAGDQVYLRWYDSLVASYVTTNFGGGIRDPRLSLDDKRNTQYALRSDIIFAYIKDDALCYRQQRDRFTIERTLEVGISNSLRLVGVGLSRGLRLQFDLR